MFSHFLAFIFSLALILNISNAFILRKCFAVYVVVLLDLFLHA